ncbi:hypothetical protein CBR_g26428 [Chara braunii]|uniref:Flavodoxin-like domain-containing protein n=1 Tax=Chara braunii TaxID=69332 RepID=A0A388L7W5_CHABU|nr:hypothetical protein CBR_g26428 [Chara braunii]|eukprot:GBG78400.1 hypothetical protein CBR_g26428 [Chara braunii]
MEIGTGWLVNCLVTVVTLGFTVMVLFWRSRDGGATVSKGRQRRWLGGGHGAMLGMAGCDQDNSTVGQEKGHKDGSRCEVSGSLPRLTLDEVAGKPLVGSNEKRLGTNENVNNLEDKGIMIPDVDAANDRTSLSGLGLAMDNNSSSSPQTSCTCKWQDADAAIHPCCRPEYYSVTSTGSRGSVQIPVDRGLDDEQILKQAHLGDPAEGDFRPTANPLQAVIETICVSQREDEEEEEGKVLAVKPAKVVFLSQTGVAKRLAEKFVAMAAAGSRGVLWRVIDANSYEPEDLAMEGIIVIVASTWQDGSAPDNGVFFLNWLRESASDFRMGAGLLTGVQFGVFGLGSRAYEKAYNVVGMEIDRCLGSLGGRRVVSMGEGDMEEGGVEEAFDQWTRHFLSRIEELVFLEGIGANQPETTPSARSKIDLESASDEVSFSDEESDGEQQQMNEEMIDLEDVAGPIGGKRLEVDGKGGIDKARQWAVAKKVGRKRDLLLEENNKTLEGYGGVLSLATNGPDPEGRREMVTPVIRASLEKQVLG